MQLLFEQVSLGCFLNHIQYGLWFRLADVSSNLPGNDKLTDSSLDGGTHSSIFQAPSQGLSNQPCQRYFQYIKIQRFREVGDCSGLAPALLIDFIKGGGDKNYGSMSRDSAYLLA